MAQQPHDDATSPPGVLRSESDVHLRFLPPPGSAVAAAPAGVNTSSAAGADSIPSLFAMASPGSAPLQQRPQSALQQPPTAGQQGVYQPHHQPPHQAPQPQHTGSSPASSSSAGGAGPSSPPVYSQKGTSMSGTIMSAAAVEHSQQPYTRPVNMDDNERIIEVSPNGRYAKMNVLLGKGAHKVVYKAIDRDEGYEVAWNCFQTTKAEYNELSSEIEILKRVRHPNIINFHDCWYNTVNGEFVFVTELMTSGTLREYIRKLEIPNFKIVKRWCRQILKGLLYLHSHNPPIIHRDIKCDNIFINGAHGEVKIGDMGTAEMKMGKKYTVIGTPEFMAPEMYEEKGYNEKVDVYAFGMCLLEMVTGEYPYNECTNAAQIYRKVVQGVKPEGMSKVTDPEVYDLITKCICSEAERMDVQLALEHTFLSVEPEVVLLSANENQTQLTLQVVFKGLDKLSAKFEFNAETDTAEEVVHEMIEENVLPLKYQTLITHEINRILRELNKLTEANKNSDEKGTWRRTDVVKDELDKAKRDLHMITERAIEAEKKAELFEVRARLAEEKTRNIDGAPPISSPLPEHSGVQQHQNDGKGTAAGGTDRMEEVAQPLKDYRDEQPIEDLVRDVAVANNRGPDKAAEWLARLQAQDVMSVGDLRDLHDADWASLGLTVFASRALRNALHGKSVRNISPKNMSRSVVTTPPVTGGIGAAMAPGSVIPDGSMETLVSSGAVPRSHNGTSSTEFSPKLTATTFAQRIGEPGAPSISLLPGMLMQFQQQQALDQQLASPTIAAPPAPLSQGDPMQGVVEHEHQSGGDGSLRDQLRQTHHNI